MSTSAMVELDVIRVLTSDAELRRYILDRVTLAMDDLVAAAAKLRSGDRLDIGLYIP